MITHSDLISWGFSRRFKWFHVFEDHYLIIGDAACDLTLESEDLSFHATKDIDMVLIVEAITLITEVRHKASEPSYSTARQILEH